jgi:hypothetical protein
MPLIQVLRNREAITSGNSAVNTIAGLNLDHWWELKEGSPSDGDFFDSGTVGGWDFDFSTSGGNRYPAMRGIVGAIRGEPKVKSVATDTRSTIVQSVNVGGNRIETGVGSVGGWMGYTTPKGSSDLANQGNKPYIGHRVLQSTSRAFWRMGLLQNGSVFMRLWTPGDAWRAEWIWGDPSVRALQKASPNHDLATGGRMHHYVVVQRRDGAGPQLYINGALETSTRTGSFVGPNADDDAWWDTLAANRSGGTSFFYELGFRGHFQLPFIHSAPLTAGEIASLYSSANVNGPCGDLHEWIHAWLPDFWKPPDTISNGMDPVQEPQGIWYEKNVGNAANDEFVDLRWYYASIWAPDGELLQTTDPTWTGVDYRVQGVTSSIQNNNGRAHGYRSGGNASPSSQPWSLKWTPANDMHRGTFGIIFQLPSDGFRLLEFVTGAANTWWRIGGDPTANPRVMRVQCSTPNGNWEIEFDYPVPSPEVIMLVVTQSGIPGEGPKTYINGVLQTGPNIRFSLNSIIPGGTFNGNEWFHTITAEGPWKINFPLDFSTFTGTWMRPGRIYDLWIKGGEPLDAAQIEGLYNLARGNIQTLPAPSKPQIAPIDPVTVFNTNDMGAYFDLFDNANVSVSATGSPRSPFPGSAILFAENSAPAGLSNPFEGVNADVEIPSPSQSVRWLNQLPPPGGLESNTAAPGALRTAGQTIAAIDGLTMIVCFTNRANSGFAPRNLWSWVDINPGAGGSQADSFSWRLNDTDGNVRFRGENQERGMSSFQLIAGDAEIDVPVIFSVTIDAATGIAQVYRDGVPVLIDAPTSISSSTDLTWVGANNAWSFGITTNGFSRMLDGVRLHACFGIDRQLSDSERQGIEQHMAELAGYTLNSH